MIGELTELAVAGRLIEVTWAAKDLGDDLFCNIKRATLVMPVLFALLFNLGRFITFRRIVFLSS